MRVDASGPSVEDLRTFVLLAELTGVAEIARRLGLDASVVSRRLRPFRTRYALLSKRGGSLVLTERGGQCLPMVRSVLHEYDALVAALRRDRQASTVLSVGVGSHGAAMLLPEVIARVMREQSGWEVQSCVCRGRERIQGLVEGRYDLAVVSHSLEQLRTALAELPVSVEPLAPQPFAVVAQRGVPTFAPLEKIPAGGSADIRDLAQITLVGLDCGSAVRAQLERRAADANVSLKFGPTAGGWMAAREYARHGLGAGIVPLAIVTEDDLREMVVRLLAQPLWPADSLLFRSASLGRVATLKHVLAETAREQARRQQARMRHFA